MNDWQKDWWRELEKTTVTLDKFFHDVNQAMESFAEELTGALEDFSEQFQDSVITEIDRCVEDMIDFIADTHIELEFNLWEDIENLVNDEDFVEITTETPSEDRYTACIGCRHYHGQAYNGQIFVCGMHPYGVEADHCLDWEQ